MNIKSKILVLSTVGAFALSYAIVGSNAFADPAAPTPAEPVLGVSVVSPIPAPVGLTSPSTVITQDDEDDDFDEIGDLDDIGEDDIDDVEGDEDFSDDEDEDEDEDDLSIMIDISGGFILSSDTEDDMGEDD